MIPFLLEPGDQGQFIALIQLLATLRAHEAEDVDSILDVLVFPKDKPRPWTSINIHEVSDRAFGFLSFMSLCFS